MKSNSLAIQALIQDFADKLDTLIRADIIHALTEIVGSGATAPAKPPKLPLGGTPARTKGAKRTPDQLEGLTKRLFAYISKHPGQRIEQIAIGMSVSTKELNLPVKKLAKDKKLSTKGQKRATTYFAK